MGLWVLSEVVEQRVDWACIMPVVFCLSLHKWIWLFQNTEGTMSEVGLFPELFEAIVELAEEVEEERG